MLLLRILILFLVVWLAPSSAFVPRASTTSHETTTSICSLRSSPSNADTATTIQSSPQRSIVVFGARGKTGRLLTKLLADQYHHVRAVTRTEGSPLPNITPTEAPYVSYTTADVRDYESIREVLKQGAAGVIWAVTSSGTKKGGGDAASVDAQGAHNVAKACLDCKVPKLAFLSAACVTHPTAPGSKMVNFLTQFTYGDTPWTDAKLAGEQAVRDLYHQQQQHTKNKKKQSAYVIVRGAAPLVNKRTVPVQDLMILQGDLYSSGESIARGNVARAVTAALFSPYTDNCTLEICPAQRLYKNEEANALDLLGLPCPHQTQHPEDLPPELVHAHADSYAQLLQGPFATDKELETDYSDIVTGYRCRLTQQETDVPTVRQKYA